jgi:periplasmic divalent cation tolerance protein
MVTGVPTHRSSDPETVVALTTLPSAEKAAEVARCLVEEGLAACVNVVAGVRSIYRWKGEVSDDQEALCVIKTARARFDALRSRLLALHPYEVPELIALDVIDGNAPYLSWVRDSSS